MIIITCMDIQLLYDTVSCITSYINLYSYIAYSYIVYSINPCMHVYIAIALLLLAMVLRSAQKSRHVILYAQNLNYACLVIAIYNTHLHTVARFLLVFVFINYHCFVEFITQSSHG